MDILSPTDGTRAESHPVLRVERYLMSDSGRVLTSELRLFA